MDRSTQALPPGKKPWRTILFYEMFYFVPAVMLGGAAIGYLWRHFSMAAWLMTLPALTGVLLGGVALWVGAMKNRLTGEEIEDCVTRPWVPWLSPLLKALFRRVYFK